jgi:hypothetical protein
MAERIRTVLRHLRQGADSRANDSAGQQLAAPQMLQTNSTWP